MLWKLGISHWLSFPHSEIRQSSHYWPPCNTPPCAPGHLEKTSGRRWMGGKWSDACTLAFHIAPDQPGIKASVLQLICVSDFLPYPALTSFSSLSDSKKRTASKSCSHPTFYTRTLTWIPGITFFLLLVTKSYLGLFHLKVLPTPSCWASSSKSLNDCGYKLEEQGASNHRAFRCAKPFCTPLGFNTYHSDWSCLVPLESSGLLWWEQERTRKPST